MIKCPKCGEEIETGAYFCSNCGTRVSAVCPKCGKKLKPDAKFCSGCGADLSAVEDEEQEENVCRHCGAKLEPDDEYCGECGKAVNDKKSDSVKKSGGSQRNTKNGLKVPSTESTEPFIMPIEDVFFIRGRGTVVTGRVKQGTACINDEVQITALGKTIDTHIIGIETFNKKLKKATAGDDVGLLLYGLEKEDVSRDRLVVTPGTLVDLATYECNMEVEGIVTKSTLTFRIDQTFSLHSYTVGEIECIRCIVDCDMFLGTYNGDPTKDGMITIKIEKKVSPDGDVVEQKAQFAKSRGEKSVFITNSDFKEIDADELNVETFEISNGILVYDKQKYARKY